MIPIEEGWYGPYESNYLKEHESPMNTFSMSKIGFFLVSVSACSDPEEFPTVDASLAIACGEASPPALLLDATLTGFPGSVWYLREATVYGRELDDAGRSRTWVTVGLEVPAAPPISLDDAGIADAAVEVEPRPEYLRLLCENDWDELELRVLVSSTPPGSETSWSGRSFQGSIVRTP